MLTFIKTDSSHKDFVSLVKHLDDELKERDGEEHEFYDQFNKIQNLKYCLIAYQDEVALGCGAIKPYNDIVIEVKRMYVLPEYRGRGVAVKVLSELENWAKELGLSNCILETGLKQPEAIALYKKSGYQITENYGQYKGIGNSVCFKKELI